MPRAQTSRPLNGRFLSHEVSALEGEPQPALLARRLREGRRRPAGADPLTLQISNQATGHGGPAPQRELVLESNNLLPFHFLRDGDRLGRAVVKLQRSDGASGTGFLVAPDLLLTNHHVLPDLRVAASAVAVANYEANPPADMKGRVTMVKLDPDSLFLTDPELDFTFCGVRGLEFLGLVPLDRSSLNVIATDCVNIIQHPRGRPKEVALQDNHVVRADNLILHYACDTEPGSSGSPVFNNQWELVALHHASVADDSGEGRRSPSEPDPGRRFLNEGIRLSAIAAWLEMFEVEQQLTPSALARIRGTFRGLDPQIGFFGALGRRSDGQGSTQAVAELYGPGGHELDVGFWSFARPRVPLADRFLDVSHALVEMGLDAWFLTHIEQDQVRALCHDLSSYYQIEHEYVYEISPGHVPLAFVYRRHAALTLERAQGPEAAHPFHLLLTMATPWGVPYTLALLPAWDDASVPSASTRRSRGVSRSDTPSTWSARDCLVLGRVDPALAPRLADTLVPRGASPGLLAAHGPSGSAFCFPAPGSPLRQLYASSNLRPATPSVAGAVRVATDRRLPLILDGLTCDKPFAIRLSLASPEKPALSQPRRRRSTRGGGPNTKPSAARNDPAALPKDSPTPSHDRPMPNVPAAEPAHGPQRKPRTRPRPKSEETRAGQMSLEIGDAVARLLRPLLERLADDAKETEP